MHLAIVGMETNFRSFLEWPFYTSFTVLSTNLKRREEQMTKAVTGGLRVESSAFLSVVVFWRVSLADDITCQLRLLSSDVLSMFCKHYGPRGSRVHIFAFMKNLI